MKFQLTFKTPDILDQIDTGSDDEIERCRDFANRWIEWGEYLIVEFDTEEGTAVVK